MPQLERQPYLLADGTQVPSVTEVISVIPKPELIRWSNQMGLKLIDTEKLVASYARGGTLLHYAIECTIKGVKADAAVVAEYTSDEQEWARTSWRAFKRWYDEHDVVPMLMEHRMVSEQMRVGGTLDLFAQVDGRISVIDWKSSGAVRGTHLTQVAAYRALIEEETGDLIDEVRVLSLPRTGKDWSETILTDTSEQLLVFKAARELYDLLQLKEGQKKVLERQFTL